MLMLITYDISFDDPNGQARLRRIAKHCLDYGVRAQYSVFECEYQYLVILLKRLAAAFGRLCVETRRQYWRQVLLLRAAAFGRLCVETSRMILSSAVSKAAAFGRLCVETIILYIGDQFLPSSRLRAAVC